MGQMPSCHKFLLQAISPAEEPMLNLVPNSEKSPWVRLWTPRQFVGHDGLWLFPKASLSSWHQRILFLTWPRKHRLLCLASLGCLASLHRQNHLKFWASTITSPTLSRSALVPGWVQMLQCSNISRNWALNLQPSRNNRKQENATDSIGFTNTYLKFMYFTSETSPNLWLSRCSCCHKMSDIPST